MICNRIEEVVCTLPPATLKYTTKPVIPGYIESICKLVFDKEHASQPYINVGKQYVLTICMKRRHFILVVTKN